MFSGGSCKLKVSLFSVFFRVFWGGFSLFVCFVVGFLGGWVFVVLLVFENVITCFVTMDNGSIAMEPSSERGHLCFIQPMDMVAENWISVSKVFGIYLWMFVLLLCLVNNAGFPSLVPGTPGFPELSRNSSLLRDLPQTVSTPCLHFQLFPVSLKWLQQCLSFAPWCRLSFGRTGTKVPSKDTSWVQEAPTFSVCLCHSSVPALGWAPGNPAGMLPGTPERM